MIRRLWKRLRWGKVARYQRIDVPGGILVHSPDFMPYSEATPDEIDRINARLRDLWVADAVAGDAVFITKPTEFVFRHGVACYIESRSGTSLIR